MLLVPLSSDTPAFFDEESSLQLQVTPRETEVFVDGYFAGRVDDFDGRFQRLHIQPGEHDLTLYLDGHRKVTQTILIRPRSSFRSLTPERCRAISTLYLPSRNVTTAPRWAPQLSMARSRIWTMMRRRSGPLLICRTTSRMGRSFASVELSKDLRSRPPSSMALFYLQEMSELKNGSWRSSVGDSTVSRMPRMFFLVNGMTA